MDFDEKGVGGFFEDLPVLVFVLAGVSILVASGVRVSILQAELQEQESVEYTAKTLVWKVVAALGEPGLEGPSTRSFNETLILAIADETVGGYSYSISFILRYPEVEWILRCGSGDESTLSSCVGSDSALMIAVDDLGRSVPVEVIAVVW